VSSAACQNADIAAVCAAFVEAEKNLPWVRIASKVDLQLRNDRIHYNNSDKSSLGSGSPQAYLEGRNGSGQNR
jgi:hypothetical protein